MPPQEYPRGVPCTILFGRGSSGLGMGAGAGRSRRMSQASVQAREKRRGRPAGALASRAGGARWREPSASVRHSNHCKQRCMLPMGWLPMLATALQACVRHHRGGAFHHPQSPWSPRPSSCGRRHQLEAPGHRRLTFRHLRQRGQDRLWPLGLELVTWQRMPCVCDVAGDAVQTLDRMGNIQKPQSLGTREVEEGWQPFGSLAHHSHLPDEQNTPSARALL